MASTDKFKTIPISRYKDNRIVLSQLDHSEDALDIIAFLKSENFVSRILVDRHGKTKTAARNLAKRIAAHASLASQYASLSRVGSPEISFLPGYYAILNLAKVCCLAGAYSQELDAHTRWHGATYNGNAKTSQRLLTEEIVVRQGGALALFYRTLTHQQIGNDKILRMENILPIVPGIGNEVTIVTGRPTFPLLIDFRYSENNNKLNVEATVQEVTTNKLGDTSIKPFEGSVRSIPCLKGFRKKPNEVSTFCKRSVISSGQKVEDAIRSCIRTEFLQFREPGERDACMKQNGSFEIRVG